MDKETHSKIILLAAILALIFAGAAAAPRPAAEAPGSPPLTRMNFESFTHGQGLGNRTINLLLEDRHGFIWAATERGLYRYDGARFELFGEAKGIPEPRVNALCLDSEGGLWVATSARLARFRDESFVTVANGLPSGTAIEDLAAGPAGELWLATDKGLFSGTETTGFHGAPGWTDASARAVFFAAKSGRVWAVGEKDLWRLSPGGRWEVIDPGGSASRDSLERALEDDQGRVWIRTEDFLWMLGPGDPKPRMVSGLYRSEDAISRMYVDPGGTLWAPNETGLARLEKGRWTQWEALDGLPTDFSRAALIDHEGSLWVGGLGLFRIIGRGGWRSATPKEDLPAPVWSFLRADGGGLWVGTQKGLAHMTSYGWEVISGSEGLSARSLAASPDGVLFMAGEPARILTWDPRSKEVSALPALPARTSWIYKILPDREARLWIGTSSAGLMSARKVDGSWRIESEPLPAGKTKESIYHILLDRAGRIWAGGDYGLACLAEGRWTRFTKKDGLLDDGVTYVIEAPSGDLWVAYYDKFGVSRVRFENGRLRVLQTIGLNEGLASVDIFLIGLDSKGRLWVGSEKGVDVVEEPESASRRVSHFGIDEGLLDDDTDAMAFLAYPNGDCWIGTRSGIGHFVAARAGGPPPPPKTIILRASLGGRPVPTGSGEPVRVSHRLNGLDVYFAAPSYVYEGAVEHQMRFFGLEERWITTAGHELRYPGLRPGPYRMEIRSRTGQGNWGPSAALAFLIQPPWWQTTWARAGGIAALLVLFYLGISLRTRALRRRAGKLESVVDKRTQELAARTRQLAAANETLRDLSLTDALTGLRNRRFLDLTLPEYLARVDRAHHEVQPPKSGPPPANIDLMLAMLDMDHFKGVNDEYGHDAGDRVLTQIATVLQDLVRDTDTVTRWGGEEFLLAFRNTSREEGSAIAERIRRRVASHAFDLGGDRVIRCTCSIGFAFYPLIAGRPQFFIWENVVEMADRCLMAAKRSGRDAWVGVLAAPDADPNEMRSRLPADLEEMVRKGFLRAATSLGDPARIAWGPKDRP
jgi:diguanylate cyclase (GGDEF)-like protein